MVTQFEKDYGYDVRLAKRMVGDVFKAPEQQREAQEFLDEIVHRVVNEAYNETPTKGTEMIETQPPTTVQKIKQKLKNSSTKLALVGAGIATLGATYFYGKTKGKLHVELNLITKDDEGEWQKVKIFDPPE